MTNQIAEQPQSIVEALAIEICKDLNYSEIYDLAQVAMKGKLANLSISEQCEEYGERYDYVFLDRGVDPDNTN